MSKNGKMTKTTGFGKELSRLRAKYNLPRRELSVLLDVSEQSIFRWESGRVKNLHPYLEQRLGYLIKALQSKEAHDERRSNG